MVKQVKSGYIPSDVTIVSAPKIRISTKWDYSEDESSILERDVYPAFALPAGDEKRLETARNWASHFCQRIKDRVESDRVESPKEITISNNPQCLYVCGLEIRGEGGRAYKVVNSENFYFDLREDVMLEAMLECGVEKGGLLGGKFLWAVVGSQMKLIRENSFLHQIMREATARVGLKKLGAPVVGGIYRSKSGATSIFLGNVMSAKTVEQPPKKKMLWLDVPGYLPGDVIESAQKIAAATFNPKNFTIRTKTSGPFEEYLGPEYIYNLKLISSHSMIEQVGTVKLPNKVIQKAHQLCLLNMQARMKYLKSHHEFSLKQVGRVFNLTDEKIFHNYQKSVVESLEYYYEMTHFYSSEDGPPVIGEYADYRQRILCDKCGHAHYKEACDKYLGRGNICRCERV